MALQEPREAAPGQHGNQPGATGSNTPGATAAPQEPPAPHWAMLPIILIGTFVITLDVFIVNVAIPATQRDLHAGSSAVEFIVAGYALAYAAGLITGGRLGDLYGRRRMFLIGVALFTLSSAWAGSAPTAGQLVAARVAQGLASALMGPQVLAIIGTVYSGPARIRAFNAFGLTMGLAGVFGQLIGGVLIHLDIAGLGWRTCFLVNVPIGIAALVFAPRVVPESKAQGKSRLDPLGMLLVSAGLVAVVLPLAEGQQKGWPEWTWVCLAVSPVLLALFALYQRRLAAADRGPLVNPALFRQRSFTVGVSTALVYYSGMASFFLVLALYLQQGCGLSALDSGLVFLPLGVGFLGVSMTAKQIAAVLGRQTLAVGALVLTASLIGLYAAVEHIGTHGAVVWLVPGLLVGGAGMAMVMAPLATVALAGTDPRYAGAASGVLSTANQVGGAIGVALVGVVFYHVLGNGTGPDAYADAFRASVYLLVPFALGVAALVQLFPRPPKKAPTS
ncbi:MFS transporter [Streptomyces malaysiense]|uniref:MFS transporter n=1 Tax=Streptomyces malaysiense TaxID=1428626 RepID=A0A1J4Q2L0_9ACTN|nr:MFS transporter [Streptomyces malaysiense]OIK27387.1 MFS transporter [Streptomyces malaysiense]